MLPAGVRIFLCTEPQDMRRSFDALALVTQQLLGEDPQSGAGPVAREPVVVARVRTTGALLQMWSERTAPDTLSSHEASSTSAGMPSWR